VTELAELIGLEGFELPLMVKSGFPTCGMAAEFVVMI
jgi:hypothetical protein